MAETAKRRSVLINESANERPSSEDEIVRIVQMRAAEKRANVFGAEARGSR